MNLTKTHYPDTGLGALPDLDVELSLVPPTQGPIWRSIVSDARLASGLSVKRGRSRETDRFQTGTLDLELNNRDREFDPEHSSSPIADHIKPERRIRVLAKYNDVQYVVFDGYVDGFEQSYPEWDSDAVASISAGDGFKVLAQADLPSSSSLYEVLLATTRPDHWWKLDEEAGQTKANDTGITGANPATGDILGSVTMGSTNIVPYDGDRTCASFTNGVIRVGGAARITSSRWSLNAVFQTTTSATNFDTIFSQRPPNTDGIWLFIASDGTLVVSSSPSAGPGGLTACDDGATHYAVVTYNGTTLSLYLDGSLNDSSAETWTPNALDDIAIASNQANSILDFVGSLAHVALWDGIVLSATQVSDLYNAGANGLTGEPTGTRLRRILDYVGWPGFGLTTAADRDIDTGSSTVGAFNLSGGSALDYLQTLHDTEQGQFYMGLDGAMSSDSVFKVCWRQRHALLTSSRSSTSQATFGDDGSELKYADILVDYGENRLFNEGRVSRSGGAEQSYADVESQREYFKRPYEKSGLLYANDNDSFDHATWAVNRYSDPALRIIGLVIKPQRDPSNLWPQVLGREIGDRITVKRRPQGVGSVISKEAVIEGVEHSMSDGEWTTVWRLSEADTTAYWVLDDSNLSVLDTTTIPAF